MARERVRVRVRVRVRARVRARARESARVRDVRSGLTRPSQHNEFWSL